MSKIKIFCFGFGQVAKYFVKKLIKEKVVVDLNVTSRKSSHNSIFEGHDLNSYELNNKKNKNQMDNLLIRNKCLRKS